MHLLDICCKIMAIIKFGKIALTLLKEPYTHFALVKIFIFLYEVFPYYDILSNLPAALLQIPPHVTFSRQTVEHWEIFGKDKEVLW